MRLAIGAIVLTLFTLAGTAVGLLVAIPPFDPANPRPDRWEVWGLMAVGALVGWVIGLMLAKMVLLASDTFDRMHSHPYLPASEKPPTIVANQPTQPPELQ
jgi:hypothetical protein